MNVLLITLDQWRGDHLGCAGHSLLQTPNLDQLARAGTRFTRHFAQASPCGPARASLYTGLYQMTHRVVANGTPLDRRFDNIAHVARRAGYRPTLFGYTDQSVDPTALTKRDDPRLFTYEGVLDGFEVGCHLPSEAPLPWLAWLEHHGFDVTGPIETVIARESERPAEFSMAAFLTDQVLDWLTVQEQPWFAHVSYFRPHPPYAAAGEFSKRYDPNAVEAPLAPAKDRSAFHEALLAEPRLAAPKEEAAWRHMRAQYLGMISEVDHQIGRLVGAMNRRSMDGDTLIVVTADHGDHLGDHGLIQKHGFHESAFHIPLLIYDPRPSARANQVIELFTESVDLYPTICAALEVEGADQADGRDLTPLLGGVPPQAWRDAVMWEFDWRGGLIAKGGVEPAELEQCQLAVLRRADAAYVHSAQGWALAFDLAKDPTWRTSLSDQGQGLALAQQLLTHRARHMDRRLTGMLTVKGGIGRWPVDPRAGN